jgi:hypothetical protein
VLGHVALGERPVAGVERDLGLDQLQPGALAPDADDLGPLVALARHRLGVLGAPGLVQEVGEVDVGGDELGEAAALGGQGDRLAQVAGPLVDLAEGHERRPHDVERAAVRSGLVGGDRGGQRLAGGLDGLAMLTAQHEHLGPQAEQHRALGARVVVGQQGQPALERAQPGLGGAQAPAQGRQPLEQIGGPVRVGRLVDLGEGGLDQPFGTDLVAVEVVGIGGAREHRRVVGTGERLGVGDARPERERALEQAPGLAVGVDGVGRLGRAQRGDQRGRLVARGEVVVGDLGGELGVGGAVHAALERPCEREVQLGALARQQVVVHDLAQEGVAEGVLAVLGHDDDVTRDGLAQGLAQHAGVQARGLRQRGVVQPAPGREQPQDLLRGLGEGLDADHERIAQRRRQLAAAVEPRGEQLLGEQGVALAALVQAIDESVFGRAPEDVRQLLGQLRARQRRELDAPRSRAALELGEHRAQRVAAVQLVGAVGGHDERALGAQAVREEGQERARRRVGPVEVLDGQQDGAVASEALEQRQERFEDARLGRRVAVVRGHRRGRRELGQEAREPGPGGRAELVEHGVAVAREGSQGGDDGGVRKLVLPQGDAIAGDDPRLGVERQALELLQQARLADARLTRDEGERRAPCRSVVHGRLQLRELAGAAYEPAARHACAHGSSIARRRRCGHVRESSEGGR